MAKRQKTIITCAVTGAIHTPTMSEALPYTYDDIASQAIAAAEAGASILHLHARDPQTGAPSVDPADFSPFLERIKQSTDAVVNISTGGSLTLSIQDRIKPAASFSAEMCSMNMGSMNFSFHPLAKRYDTWKYDWEKGHLESSKDYVFKNTFSDIEEILRTGASFDARFEMECYDVG
ncbi:MAG: 3-keto-5-aminohexanoate cleavage protein, partial [Pseudomonadota bacterium]